MQVRLAPRELVFEVADALHRRPVLRVAFFTAMLAGLAGVAAWAILRPYSGDLPSGLHLPWPIIAAGFLLAELKVVDVHFKREKHSFSLSEFPAVIGLFTLYPSEYLLSVIIGTSIALAWSRQAPIKFGFNLVNFAGAAVLMQIIFHVGIHLDGGGQVSVWVAAFGATISASVYSALTIATAISLSGGAPQYQKLPEMMQFGGLVAVANTSLALLAVAVLDKDPTLLVLLVVPLITVFLAYRAYLSEREKHERLELLYQSSRILQHSPELDSAVLALLEHARNMFRAERAELLLYPRHPGDDSLLSRVANGEPARAMEPMSISDDDPIFLRIPSEQHAFFYVPQPGAPRTVVRQAMIAALRGEAGIIGSIMVANRMTEGTSFLDEDLPLLETVANHAAVALENGQLEQSLAELSRLKEQLRYQAYHDPLTALPNRSLLLERVSEMIAQRRPDSLPVVLFLDLDNFKVVNDTLGHAAGDRLLVAVADRIRECVREGDVAARLGGDEFAMLLRDEPALDRALAVTRRVLDALRLPFQVEGQDVSVSGSIGIAAATPGIERGDELLRNADVAMYTAKQDGKSRFAVFDPNVHAEMVARHAMSSDLGKAIARNELSVKYQPIFTLATGTIVGVEALVRWNHPRRGTISPDDFIFLAEETGSILELGRWVLDGACHEMAHFDAIETTGPPMMLTVNLAAAQLKQPEFVDELEKVLAETRFPANRLVLELTETAMFSDTQTTIARLQALRELGVQIAIDDFGTGYSSLGYLRRFRVDILKIARDFVGRADDVTDDWAFAHAIVALGRSLGLRIVAEGIEQQGQLERLREMGCEFGQGFLFAAPLDADEMAQLLRSKQMPVASAGGQPARVAAVAHAA